MTLGYEEVQDRTAPLPQRIAFRAMDINARINDQFGRSQVLPGKEGRSLWFERTRFCNGPDRYRSAGSRSHGEFIIQVRYQPDRRVCQQLAEKSSSQNIDKISFAESRNILGVSRLQDHVETRGYRIQQI